MFLLTKDKKFSDQVILGLLGIDNPNSSDNNDEEEDSEVNIPAFCLLNDVMDKDFLYNLYFITDFESDKNENHNWDFYISQKDNQPFNESIKRAIIDKNLQDRVKVCSEYTSINLAYHCIFKKPVIAILRKAINTHVENFYGDDLGGDLEKYELVINKLIDIINQEIENEKLKFPLLRPKKGLECWLDENNHYHITDIYPDKKILEYISDDFYIYEADFDDFNNIESILNIKA